ncbi:transcriptional regulator GcvA [Caenispirillum bisanense]|uniref:Transcriptional regulator, LysR family n=1 Tax=Caenispirillum bisanense TaxID=414052 RepID=A0A286GH57_9PROT|nr:transcriptional regulator GcvA [Caenispirillum bisanense]SOD94867.1 transcriptional regulator, LysR family [Caenispirillum bisanense]
MSRPLPPLNALRAFEAAARHLSFVKAADELAVTPAAVSQQVKGLEERLGQTLFRRVTRGLRLTAAGQTLLPGLSEGFDRIAEAVAEVTGGSDDDLFTVSVLPSFAAHWLVPRLVRFGEISPEVRIVLLATVQRADFQGDRVDAAIRYAPAPPEGVENALLMRETVFPVCSPALAERLHLRTPEDLVRAPILYDLLPDGRLDNTWGDWLKAAGLPAFDWKTGTGHSDTTVAMQAAIAGQGVLLGRDLLVADLLARGLLVAPFELRVPSPFTYWLLWPRRTARRKAWRTFRRWLDEEVAACCVTTPAE